MFPLFSSVVRQIACQVRSQIILYAHCNYRLVSLNTISWKQVRYESSSDAPPDPPKDRSCKQFTTIGKIINFNSPKNFGSRDKISIIGIDDVGVSIVYTLLAKGITDNICMIDYNEEVLQGEFMDLQSSALFLGNPRITCSKDLTDTRNSKVIIITTGTFKGRDEDELEYVARNSGIIRAIVSPTSKHSPDAIYIIASDPVDILSYVTWRLIGTPKNRVIGTGTLIDTARFRYFLSDKFGVSPKECHGYIIGEHGQNNSVPVWSSVNVAGVRLQDINPQIGLQNDPEKWSEMYTDAVKSDNLVRQLKGVVSWSVALGVTEICSAILNNAYTVLPVSTFVKGEHAIRDEVFLSLPCVIGKLGVTDIIRQTLSDHESSMLRRGAENVARLQETANRIIS